MDITGDPDDAKVTITADGAPVAVVGQNWATNQRLRVRTNHAYDADDIVWLTFAGNDPDMKTVAGSLVDPYGPLLVPDPIFFQQERQQWIDDHSPPPPPGTPERDAWDAARIDWIEQHTGHGPPGP